MQCKAQRLCAIRVFRTESSQRLALSWRPFRWEHDQGKSQTTCARHGRVLWYRHSYQLCPEISHIPRHPPTSVPPRLLPSTGRTPLRSTLPILPPPPAAFSQSPATAQRTKRGERTAARPPRHSIVRYAVRATTRSQSAELSLSPPGSPSCAGRGSADSATSVAGPLPAAAPPALMCIISLCVPLVLDVSLARTA